MHSVSLDPKTQGRCPRREYDARHTDTRDHIVIRSNYTPQSVLSFHDQRVIDELPVRLDLEAEAMKEASDHVIYLETQTQSSFRLARDLFILNFISTAQITWPRLMTRPARRIRHGGCHRRGGRNFPLACGV